MVQTMDQGIKQFDFGENWKNFSQKALTDDRLEQSKQDFQKLVQEIDLNGKTFLDIGFGQGLGLLNAATLGAKIVGNDINPKCAEVLKFNQQRFPNLKDQNFLVVVGSILQAENVEKLRQQTAHQGFDVVHSWGVLHHTGQMWKAIENAISLVKPQGYFILAIYKKHWTSPIWLFIKWFYNILPAFLRKIMIGFFVPLVWLRLVIGGQNPLKMDYRGMNFYYDVIDWVGGYPYEYASEAEITEFMKNKGFELVKFIPTYGFTGCHEYVYQHRS